MSQPATERFTGRLAPDELAALDALARELGSSRNYVLRTFVRTMLGLPISPWARERLSNVASEYGDAPTLGPVRVA